MSSAQPTGGATARPRVAVAGASGFVGTALTPRLAERFAVVALTRSPERARRGDANGRVQWRHTDLFDAEAVCAALRGVDYAVYLVHSLAPSSRLTQARPRDLDLVLADHFAHAAAVNGVKQILFVSGVMPRSHRFSPLLWSRREVEMVLASRGTPLTALRASLVVGPGGTGSQLLLDLVRRLPLLVVPPQAASLTRPIALVDLVRAILRCLGEPQRFHGAFDVGGADTLSYLEMLRQTAEVLGVKRRLLLAPLLPSSLASAVARWVSGAPTTMIGAIVESLPQDTRMQDNTVQRLIDPAALGFREALRACVAPDGRQRLPRPRAAQTVRDHQLLRAASRVRSIQRILLPPGQDAAWVADNYFRWLGSCCWPLVRTRVAEDLRRIEVWLSLPRLCLLVLERQEASSSPRRQVFSIQGGWLSRDTPVRGRFEFHTLLDARYTMTAIHDYAPALPWYLYLPTQAFAHGLVMGWYQRRLARLAR